MKMKRIEDGEDGEDEEEESSLRKLCIVYCRKLKLQYWFVIAYL